MSKSYISALVGLAFEQGCLTSLDQPFLDFFLEYADQIEDPRKEQITIRYLLQIRSGYPWEGMLTRDFRSHIVQFPLVTDPGTKFHYSNATSDWLGVIVARACDVDHSVSIYWTAECPGVALDRLLATVPTE